MKILLCVLTYALCALCLPCLENAEPCPCACNLDQETYCLASDNPLIVESLKKIHEALSFLDLKYNTSVAGASLPEAMQLGFFDQQSVAFGFGPFPDCHQDHFFKAGSGTCKGNEQCAGIIIQTEGAIKFEISKFPWNSLDEAPKMQHTYPIATRYAGKNQFYVYDETLFRYQGNNQPTTVQSRVVAKFVGHNLYQLSCDACGNVLVPTVVEGKFSVEYSDCN